MSSTNSKKKQRTLPLKTASNCFKTLSSERSKEIKISQMRQQILKVSAPIKKIHKLKRTQTKNPKLSMRSSSKKQKASVSNKLRNLKTVNDNMMKFRRRSQTQSQLLTNLPNHLDRNKQLKKQSKSNNKQNQSKRIMMVIRSDLD